ncbi:hypothetical protein [Arcticibacterium luteifluviistationis]|uniref:Uncharacterized protein n=1 Tax=Arcticibacterium luteifluviistationis TaxID=1784714 RepID=A0A2Z4GFN9_9BACT|nr:hypothetical protein [Arcticibacterium luteifluviistationis]AWV99798.1 hypothetical protein DJ013_17105 [Arcticibacterium luteifluviistationis]
MKTSYNSFSGNFSQINSTVNREVSFSGRDQYYIEINDGLVNMRFDFTFSNETKIYKLTEGKYFKSADIRQIAKQFDLSVENNPYSNTLACSIQGLPESYGYSIYGAEVNKSNGVYLCLFAKKGESVFTENIYFIQGIYKINKSLLPC